MAVPPRPEHPLLVALAEMYARQIQVEPAKLWAWLDRREAPPPDVLRGLLEAFYPTVRAEDFGESSTSVPKDDRIGTSMQLESPIPIRGARPADHPFPQALRSRGITITEWAENHDVSRAQAKSWYLDAPAGRPIPQRFAEELHRAYGVPFTAWPNGVSKKPRRK